MKGTILLMILWSGFLTISAQSFHFEDSSTTIIKTTAQSPAHWYLEIYNNLNVKDTLRWRTHFSTIPLQWNINFDTQAGYFNPVLDGDSADLILLDSLDFPQKLIIGAETNNTPGHGSVFFEIYDPNDQNTLVTIEYEFIITDVNVGVEEEELPVYISISNKVLYINTYFSFQLILMDLKGSMVHNCSNCKQVDLSDLTSGIYMVNVQTEQKNRIQKFYIE